MRIISHFITVLAVLFMSVPLFAGSDVDKRLQDVLKMKITPDEMMDSVYMVLADPELHLLDSLPSSKAERFFRERLIKYAERNKFPDDIMASIYNELGLLCTHQGPDNVSKARKAYDKALEYSERAKSTFTQGIILERRAQLEAKFGDMAESFKYSKEAIKCYKKCGKDAEQRITRCYYTQAVAYLQGFDLAGMRTVIDSIADFSRKVSEENKAHVLYNLYSVQEVYYGTLAQDAAADKKKALMDTLNQVSLASVLLIDANYEKWQQLSIDPTWNYYNRAVMFVEYSDRPDIDSVEYYLNKAVSIEHARSTHALESEISAASLRAEMWMKHGDYNKARNILLDVIRLLDNTEGINNVIYDKIEIYKNLVEIAKQSGHYEEALGYADKLSEAEKQRFSDVKAKDIKELEIKYKTQETELALARSEAGRAQTLVWFFAAAFLLLVAVTLFVIYAGRQRRNRMMKEMEFAALKADTERELTIQYVKGLENERQRMSRELHDGVCNDLLAIQMNISGGKPIESTAKLIDSCRESVRRISHELMPPEFSYASIDEVVRFFVAKQASSNEGKINISFSSSIEESRSWQDVPDSVALEVYRIVQEAVGNAVKHSGATEINVSLNLDANGLTADVRDNGIFKSEGRKGIGLESINRRAGSVNGTVEILSDEKTFTDVCIKIRL